MVQDFDYLFAKSQLPKDAIDLGIGESNILRESVIETYNLKALSFENLPNIFEYAPPNGYGPLVERLESIYKAKIVVTQSAKHALSASFYAMKATGKNKIHFKSPYWPSIPALITREGLNYSHLSDNCDCRLIVSPNNPDGTCDFSDSNSVPTIHDGAYFTNAYIDTSKFNHLPYFDMQIFSVSKMYGLSGARLGYIVCNNLEYYTHLNKFVEASIAGVSTIPQALLLHILTEDFKYPQKRIDYEKYVNKYIAQNRKYCMENLDHKHFGFDRSSFAQVGMFLWVKCKIQDFTLAGVNIMCGAPFGNKDYIRLNLSVDLGKIIKAVNRMNEFANKV